MIARNIRCFAFLLLALVSINVSGNVYGQSAKKFYQAGKDFLDASNFNDAIAQFSKAIDLNPNYEDAYQKRAESFEKLNKFQEASDDYNRLVAFNPKDAEVLTNLGRMYIELGNNKEAVAVLNRATKYQRSYVNAYQAKVIALLRTEELYNALKVSDSAIAIKSCGLNFYNQGLVYQKLNSLPKAEEAFNKAVKKDDKFIDAFIELANVKNELGKNDEAMKIISEALKINGNNKQVYLTRSKILIKKLDYPGAINDISKNILMDPQDAAMYFTRGLYYQQFTQHQNAINDFTKVIGLNPKNAEAYYKRASSYEEVADYKSAIKDYETLASLSEYDVQARKLLDAAKLRLFVLNKETNKPEIIILDPVQKTNLVLEIPQKQSEFIIKGKMTDQSDIKFLKINDLPISFVKNGSEYTFITPVFIDSSKSINIAASDIYDNVQNLTLKIKSTEITPPSVSIIAPVASDNGDVYLASGDNNLYVEGKIADESLIKSILIDGISASYPLNENNPTFSANILVANKNKFTIEATDIYGNKSIMTYNLNRDAIAMQEDSPMGKTWAVFINNSNYKNFPSLEGPEKDVTLMKTALARYKIHNIVVKNDMTKEQMEKFFSIELRDLVRSNKVNSLLVWYAGHGKYINETGYWIPTGAVRDDEFTYFNINSLKASMQAYATYVTHVLVITDACESGPSFYQAMRSIPKERNCSDWQATKFKSSQVFSSAGYELAVDNSQFTRTFANVLANNPDACLPIESIVNKVTVAVAKNKQQRPQFGKIAGLEDEDGTFFFISKQ